VSSSCFSCGKRFGLLTWRHPCAICAQEFCDACSGKKLHPLERSPRGTARAAAGHDRELDVCAGCHEKITSGAGGVIVVRAAAVGGYRTVRRIGRVSSWLERLNPEQSIQDARVLVQHAGGNALLNMCLIKDGGGEPSQGMDGTPGDSVYTCAGDAAVVERRAKRVNLWGADEPEED
jgi:hypothetical protein